MLNSIDTILRACIHSEERSRWEWEPLTLAGVNNVLCRVLTFPPRSDTVRYALDILSMLTVVPKIQLLLADAVVVLDEGGSTVSTVGKCWWSCGC